VLTPALLGKFEELYARILRRDQRLSKLKIKNRGLQSELDELEELMKELSAKLEESEHHKEELQLQNSKFECRLKQAQIILNDPTDRVDL